MIAAFAAIGTSARPTARAQTPQQTTTPPPQQRPPVFRAGANFVYVDAYPRKDGKLVDNLTPEDFEIYEDGVKQTVETFEIVRPPRQTPEVERRDPNTTADADRQAADPHRRLFVIYLNRFFLSMEASRVMREPLMTFLRQVIGPEDLFGVMTPAITVAQVTWARQLDVVGEAIDRYWRLVAKNFEESDPVPETPYEKMLYGCYINRTGNPDVDKYIVNSLIRRSRMDDLFGGLKLLIQHLAAMREARTNLIFVTGGFELAGQNMKLSEYLWQSGPPTVGVDPSGKLTVGSTQPDRVDRQGCDRELMRLSMIDFIDRRDETIELARRAHVAFYPIHPAGLSAYDVSVATPGGRPAPTMANVERMLDVLHRLANTTDGRAVVLTNDLNTPLREIAADLSIYYLLGYYSTNNKYDGKYRKIDVKLRQKGIDVVARPGYQPPSESDKRAAEGAAGPVVARDADIDSALGRLGRIRPDADIRVAAIGESSAIRVIAEIGRATAARMPWSGGAPVTVSILASDGRVVGPAVGNIEPGTRGAAIDVPRPADGGPWRAAVRIGGGNAVLQETSDVAAEEPGVLGAILMFRATPSPRSPIVATVDPLYRRTERAHAEWTIAAGVVVSDVHARLLDRNGTALSVPVTIGERREPSPHMTADVNLAPLTEGDYVLEVTARSDSANVRKLAAIRVMR